MALHRIGDKPLSEPMRQAVIWANANLMIHWRIYASLGADELLSVIQHDGLLRWNIRTLVYEILIIE